MKYSFFFCFLPIVQLNIAQEHHQHQNIQGYIEIPMVTQTEVLQSANIVATEIV